MGPTVSFAEPRSEPIQESSSQAVLKTADFKRIGEIVYQSCGINLTSGKEELVRSRLIKRLRALNLPSYSEYLQHVVGDSSGHELRIMIDCLTTNKTSFFRENQHFDYLRTRILPAIKKRDRGVRIWSAGCSSGEEPYTIAMLLSEEISDIEHANVKVLATDISERVLAKARAGEYEKETVQDIPAGHLAKYFTAVKTSSGRTYTVQNNIKKLVSFARLNLMDRWPMKGPFDVIFCRNVMIYFDAVTQRNLVQRFHDLLMPGGHLLVGHSESLVANSAGFKYVQPATYVKQAADAQGSASVNGDE